MEPSCLRTWAMSASARGVSWARQGGTDGSAGTSVTTGRVCGAAGAGGSGTGRERWLKGSKCVVVKRQAGQTSVLRKRPVNSLVIALACRCWYSAHARADASKSSSSCAICRASAACAPNGLLPARTGTCAGRAEVSVPVTASVALGAGTACLRSSDSPSRRKARNSGLTAQLVVQLGERLRRTYHGSRAAHIR